MATLRLQAMQNRISKHFYLAVLMLALVLLFSCSTNNIEDSNVTIDNKTWNYQQTALSTIEVKDSVKSYNVYFKLRHTADYRYANLYTIFRLKGNGLNQKVRYQFKLAQADGLWLGKGSGDIYTAEFLLLKDFHFPKSGKYTLEVEQNMRDNPLVGVSDIGIKVSINP